MEKTQHNPKTFDVMESFVGDQFAKPFIEQGDKGLGVSQFVLATKHVTDDSGQTYTIQASGVLCNEIRDRSCIYAGWTGREVATRTDPDQRAYACYLTGGMFLEMSDMNPVYALMGYEVGTHESNFASWANDDVEFDEKALRVLMQTLLCAFTIGLNDGAGVRTLRQLGYGPKSFHVV